jgi:DNA-binding MarR family transcriptional regulator
MTVKQPPKKTFSQKEAQRRISSLSRQIVSLSDDLKANTLFSIISTADVVHEFERVGLKQSGSGRTRLRILNALITHGGSLTLTETSKKVSRSKHSTTRLIDKLIKEDLVEKEAGAGDRRTRNITITKKGIEFIEKTLPRRREMSDKATSCLTGRQMVTLMGLQKKLKKHLFGLISKMNINRTEAR